MTDLTCIDCGAPAHISDRGGAYCRTHWDEREAAKHAEERRATEEAGGPWLQLCPRRVEDGALDRYVDPNRPRDTPDTWDIREQMHKGLQARHCSYCGSLHPDDFMRLVEEGWTVGATDKSYKAYLGSPDPGGSSMETKFYFQHLSGDQRETFVGLYNERKIAFSGGGGFYRLPFFMKPSVTQIPGKGRTMTVLNNLRLVAGKKTFVGDDPAYRPLTPRERVMVLFGIFVYHLPCDLGYRLFPGMYGSER